MCIYGLIYVLFTFCFVKYKRFYTFRYIYSKRKLLMGTIAHNSGSKIVVLVYLVSFLFGIRTVTSALLTPETNFFFSSGLSFNRDPFSLIVG